MCVYGLSTVSAAHGISICATARCGFVHVHRAQHTHTHTHTQYKRINSQYIFFFRSFAPFAGAHFYWAIRREIHFVLT